MEIIPYTVEERPDTGLFNAKLGIWLFLASEVMLFGALFSSYILLRVSAHNWPEGSSLLSTPIGTLNTLILISSSVTMVMAWASLKERNFKRYKLFIGSTVLLGLAFLLIKILVEYHAKFEHHHFPKESTFLAIYFTLTGLHGIHVLGGVILNSYFWFPGAKMWFEQPERFTNRIEVAGLYWHFVDLVWIFLFPVLYLL